MSVYNIIDQRALDIAQQLTTANLHRYRDNLKLQEAFENGDGKVVVTHKVTFEQAGAETVVAVDTSFVHTKVKTKDEVSYDPAQAGLPFGQVNQSPGAAAGNGGAADDPMGLNGDENTEPGH